MNEMNILTLNGEQYEVADQKARIEKLDIAPLGEATGQDIQEVHYNPVTKKLMTKKGGGTSIDDSTISTDSTWSSQKMVDTFYGYMPVTVSGNYISVNDVSGVTHEMKCKISGDVPDLTAVRVSRYGKNLFNIFKISNYTDRDGSRIVNNENGSVTLTPGPGSGVAETRETMKEICPGLMANTNYVLSGKSTVSDPSDRCIRIISTRKLIHFGDTFSLTESELNSKIYLYSAIDVVTISDLQIEHNTIPTEFSPYIDGESYHSNESGIVSGMTSVYPDMTIYTDNPNVTIDATYNADIKKYIDIQSSQVTDAILSLGGNV